MNADLKANGDPGERVALAGGADSTSDVPLAVSKRLTAALVEAQKAKTLLDKVKAFARVAPKDLVPQVPGFSREPATGETMGEAAEKYALLTICAAGGLGVAVVLEAA